MSILSFARMFSSEKRRAPSPPEGLRLYAIGDIHGRLDLLETLARRIEADLKDAPTPAVTIFLGDYVDRGPDSAGVLDRLARRDFPTEFLALRGNHEEVMLKFLENPDILESWRNYGGLETLHSYGTDVFPAMRGMGYEAIRENFLERLPGSHVQFLRDTAHSTTFGDYFFCHAGARPGVALDRQTPRDLLWIREEFLEFRGGWDKVVVHGHTPVAEPELLTSRINVDTGAFASSILTAVALEGSQRRIISTARSAGRSSFEEARGPLQRQA
ncbi:MAG TPA: metallophosphoesterase family protein [Methylocystis sp.]|nr:metallophosphoesterase family protein [Methylocystis sp.]